MKYLHIEADLGAFVKDSDIDEYINILENSVIDELQNRFEVKSDDTSVTFKKIRKGSNGNSIYFVFEIHKLGISAIKDSDLYYLDIEDDVIDEFNYILSETQNNFLNVLGNEYLGIPHMTIINKRLFIDSEFVNEVVCLQLNRKCFYSNGLSF